MFCNYSLVPKPRQTIICSKCGKKIEGLPYYNQVAKMYNCFLKQNGISYFIGLGLGAPMCDECDDEVDNTIEETKNKSKNRSLAGAIIVLVLFVILRSAKMNTGLVFALIIVCIGVTILVIKNDEGTQHEIDEKLTNSGLNVVKGLLDYFKKKGWKQEADVSMEARDYTEDNLKSDLSKLCDGGIYCVLDNRSGMFVDHRDPKIVKEIYNASIWKKQ